MAAASTKKKPTDADGEQPSGSALSASSAAPPSPLGEDGVARGEATGDGSGARLPDADVSTIGPDAKELGAPAQTAPNAVPLKPPVAPPSDEVPPDAPNEKEPSVPTLEEWVKAGYEPDLYHHRFGKNPKPNTPAARAAESSAKRAYRIWPHGDLHRNGKVHAPGSTIHLTDAEAEGLGCVSLDEG
jgi:hypothetical protein